MDDETSRGSLVADPARAGSDHEFEAAYRRLYPRLVAVARRHAEHEQGAQDLLQSAAYKAYVRFRSGKPIANLEAYLTACLYNVCMDLHRWSRRQQRVLEQLAVSEEWFAQSAHEEVVDRATQDLVGRAFTRLSDECQELLILRVIEGVPVKDVARRLVIAEGTVKSKCSRCLVQLGRLMDD